MCLHTVEMVLQQASSNFAALSPPTTKQNKNYDAPGLWNHIYSLSVAEV